MDPDTIVRICQFEQKGLCFFLFHLFGLIISALLTCLLLFHVERWCFYSKQTVRLDFSDLTKLPGEEQVDIIAWGTQVRKNIFFSCERVFRKSSSCSWGGGWTKNTTLKKNISNA